MLTFHHKAPSFSLQLLHPFLVLDRGWPFNLLLISYYIASLVFFKPAESCYTITRHSRFVCSLMKRSAVGPAASTLGPATMSYWGSACQDRRAVAVKVWAHVSATQTESGLRMKPIIVQLILKNFQNNVKKKTNHLLIPQEKWLQ